MFYAADVGSQSVSCVAFCGTLMCAFQRQAAQRGAELLRWIKFSQRQYLPVFGYCQENHIRPAWRCSSAVPARSCSAPLGNSVLRTHFSSSPLCLAKALFMDHIGFIPHINSKSDSFFLCVCVLLPFLHRAGASCFDAVGVIYLNSWCNTNCASELSLFEHRELTLANVQCVLLLSRIWVQVSNSFQEPPLADEWAEP